ncbi:ABC transporter substrate-binding protein [Lichenihabitans sp. Uapishka_5]|uniref:ABC transporter substrate-binding protein n=1 Tax=Lichenihabitans sp. Uapishka_5 TaxID=3037302 RepID=UPI0029E7F95A|nr:ABC transporter substrate-binding protein [Lichenihabitans sp. Uapishka_5]MDX7951217.1 ABC transporter substrate-binding protein [Lichenihabitans sp. Uapishka_5]
MLLPLALTRPAWAADTKDMKIALSNNYAGNSWRQSMLQSWEKVTKQAVADGLVAEAPAFTTAENQATEQAAQIQNMILQGYNAIVIDAASPSAVNGAIKQACDAGIVVVTFDGIATEPCAYRIAVDFKKLGGMQIDYFKSRGLKGNLLEVRGLAGVFVDDEIHAGIEAGVKADADLKIVGSVHGDWTQTVAQKEVAGVLPTLPPVAAVATQGGDGFGVAQAFKDAGRTTPVIFLGNREDELSWWKQQRDANGYQTMSASIAPGSSTFAFWVARKILAGETLPKDMLLPITVVTQDTLDAQLKNTEKGGVTNVLYADKDVTDILAKAGH